MALKKIVNASGASHSIEATSHSASGEVLHMDGSAQVHRW
jgi:hypothetical protein